MGRVTIHDVAKAAGVSHTTVSWAIHDDPRITRETKDRVLAAVAALKYHPNLNARSLISGKAGMIAVIGSFFSSMFELEVMRGIEESLEELGDSLGVQLFLTRGSSTRKSDLFNGILYGRRADAVICLSLRPDDQTAAEYVAAGIPIILIEEYCAGAVVIKTNNRLGGRLAVEHLIRSGRRRIGFIGGHTSGQEAGISAAERLAGYGDGLLEAGIAFDPALVAEVEHYYQEEGLDALRSVFTAAPVPDAVFCAAGDLVAIGAISMAKDMGLRIPEDLAIIGFDDTFIAPLVSPALTTVRQPLRLMGRTAALAALREDARRDTEFLPELIVRGSA